MCVFRHKGWLSRPEGTYPSVKSLGSEPRDPEPLAEFCNANMCLALQPRRGRTKTENFQEMSVERIRVKQKPLSPGGDSPDLRCTSALSINTSHGLLALVSLWCINQLGSDLTPSAGLNARWNRGEKLKIPEGGNIFVIVMQKKRSFLLASLTLQGVTTTKPC